MKTYKEIPGYKNYGISRNGEVMNLKFNKLVKNVLTKGTRYYRVSLSNNSKVKTHRIHQLMAITYLNHIPDGTQNLVVDHINNNRLDNRLENLQIITQKENVQKYFREHHKKTEL